MVLVWALVSLGGAALVAQPLQRRLGRATDWPLAGLFLVLSGVIASQAPAVLTGRPVTLVFPWIPTLGVVLTLIGVAALLPDWWGAVKTLAAIVLQLTTSALGGFAVARAAYRSRVPLSPETRYDQLAEDTGMPGPSSGGPAPEDFGPR